MVKSECGKVEVIGEAIMVLSELEQLIMRVKKLLKNDEVMRMVFDSDLLAMFLAKDENEFVKNEGEADKKKLLKKIDKVYKFMEENARERER